MIEVLPDYVAPDLDVIFCGTAVGAMSAARGHYYARPGNRFWRILALTGLTPRQLCPDEDYLMPSMGFGLTDLAKYVSGQDAQIAKTDYLPTRLFALMAAMRPRALAFTSLTAARIALQRPRATTGRLAPDLRLPDNLAIWALPSPSGLASRHFSIGPWQALADWRKEG